MNAEQRVVKAEERYSEFLKCATTGQRPVSLAATRAFLEHLKDLEARLQEIRALFGGVK